MRGPVSQTIGPSSIGELQVHLLLVEICDRNTHAAGPEEELHAWEIAQLRCPSGGDPPHLEKLERQEELGLANELLSGLAGCEEDAVWEVDLDARHDGFEDSTDRFQKAGSRRPRLVQS